jgi:hypothetical protein
VDNLIAMLRDDPGVVVHRHCDTVSFIFDDTVLLRIKKADIELMSGNVQTELASPHCSTTTKRIFLDMSVYSVLKQPMY